MLGFFIIPKPIESIIEMMSNQCGLNHFFLIDLSFLSTTSFCCGVLGDENLYLTAKPLQKKSQMHDFRIIHLDHF